MYMDKLCEFDPFGSAITVTRVSTNIWDVGVSGGLPPSPQGRDMGIDGMVLDIFAVVETAFTAAGAATLQVQIQAALDNAGSPGTWYNLMMTDAIPVANLVAGVEICRTPLPMWQPAQAGVDKPPRFYQLNYVVATGPMTAGAVQAEIVLHNARPQTKLFYPSGFNPSN